MIGRGLLVLRDGTAMRIGDAGLDMSTPGTGLSIATLCVLAAAAYMAVACLLHERRRPRADATG